jgi:hypothetical protein
MRPTQSFPTPLKKVRRNKALSRFIWTLVILVVLFIGLGLLSHIPKVIIREVDVSGTKVLNGEEISQNIKEYLEGNIAIFYARGNVFLYSKNKLESFILEKFPRVYRVVEITRDGRKLNIVLEERQAAFTWCGDIAPVYALRFEKRDCYFLDQTGFIFDTSPFFTPGVYLAFYGGIKSDVEPIGQTLITQNSIMDFGRLSEVFEKLSLPIHSVVIKSDGQNEFLLNIFTTTNNYAKILFNEDIPLLEIESKIYSAVAEESFTEQFSDSDLELEYIDTRFSNRVFYKFRN